MIQRIAAPRISTGFLLSLMAIASVAQCDEHDYFGTTRGDQHAVVGLSGRGCINCHGGATTTANVDVPPDVRGTGNDGWIRRDELSIWVRDDLHYQAYAVLLNKQSEQIGERLGIKAHLDRRCLACHSSVPVNAMKTDGDRVVEDTTRNPLYTIGVSCEGCHGPAGTTKNGEKGWEDVHVVDKQWRSMSAKTRFEQFGYWDVHSTRSQTRICLSCHMGNVDQGKVITHEMYAAGHPPLPSFELSQFIQQMPRHWRRFDEKEKSLRDNLLNALQAKSDGPPPVEIFDARDVVVTKKTMIAALVTLEESMRLTADMIDQRQSNTNWPELANYACFACHHELSRDSWRKKSRLTTVAGRPPLHEWPFAIAKSVAPSLEQDGLDFKWDEQMRGLVAALDAKPYGEFEALKRTSTELADTLQNQSRKLLSITIDQQTANRFLNRIAVAGATEIVDYDSARQLAWAFERTHVALATPIGSPSSPDSLCQSASNVGSGESGKTLKELEQNLSLCLAGQRTRGTEVKLPGADGKIASGFTHKLNVVDLSISLDRIARYQPQAVQPLFQRLQQGSPIKTGDSK